MSSTVSTNMSDAVVASVASAGPIVPEIWYIETGNNGIVVVAFVSCEQDDSDRYQVDHNNTYSVPFSMMLSNHPMKMTFHVINRYHLNDSTIVVHTMNGDIIELKVDHHRSQLSVFTDLRESIQDIYHSLEQMIASYSA